MQKGHDVCKKRAVCRTFYYLYVQSKKVNPTCIVYCSINPVLDQVHTDALHSLYPTTQYHQVKGFGHQKVKNRKKIEFSKMGKNLYEYELLCRPDRRRVCFLLHFMAPNTVH